MPSTNMDKTIDITSDIQTKTSDEEVSTEDKPSNVTECVTETECCENITAVKTSSSPISTNNKHKKSEHKSKHKKNKKHKHKKKHKAEHSQKRKRGKVPVDNITDCKTSAVIAEEVEKSEPIKSKKKKIEKSSSEELEECKKDKGPSFNEVFARSDSKKCGNASQSQAKLESDKPLKISHAKKNKDNHSEKHHEASEESLKTSDEEHRKKDRKSRNGDRANSEDKHHGKDKRNESTKESSETRDKKYSNTKNHSNRRESRRSRSGSRSTYRSRSDYRHQSRDSQGDSRSKHSRYHSPDLPHSSRYKERDRSRSRHRFSPDLREKIDKKKLLEIARRNAVKMVQQGTFTVSGLDQEKLMQIKSGGKSVEELTNFCKQLAVEEGRTGFSEDSSDSENDNTFINHPFQIKEKPSNIVMNVRNAPQLPARTPLERSTEKAKLRITYPVSSGEDHRGGDAGSQISDWVPVSPKKASSNPIKEESQSSPSLAEQTKVAVIEGIPEIVDIGSLITQRLKAMRRLQEVPDDPQAIADINNVQKGMGAWAVKKSSDISKSEPGIFTGSTGVKVLSYEQLTSGQQAWARKDQFKNAAPVSGGMGMFLLQKMGWKPGEGLGKNNEGQIEPLRLDIKTDKKGLTTKEEVKKNPITPVVRDLSGKHPVSAVTELCIKKRWGVPRFDMVFEYGPDHKKQFLFQVTVNNHVYKPKVASTTKKLAKACCAAYCLQQFGLLAADQVNDMANGNG